MSKPIFGEIVGRDLCTVTHQLLIVVVPAKIRCGQLGCDKRSAVAASRLESVAALKTRSRDAKESVRGGKNARHRVRFIKGTRQRSTISSYASAA